MRSLGLYPQHRALSLGQDRPSAKTCGINGGRRSQGSRERLDEVVMEDRALGQFPRDGEVTWGF